MVLGLNVGSLDESPVGVSSELQAEIRKRPEIREHPKGSTKYLCCYIFPHGQTVALERKGKNGATFWMREEHCPVALPIGLAAERSRPWPEPGRYGRNSNLKRLPELAEARLCRLQVPSLEIGLQLLKLLG